MAMPRLTLPSLAVAAAVLLWLALPGAAAAQPREGFSLMLSSVEHEGTLEFDDGTEVDYASSGVGVGADYQWPVSPRVSLSVFYQTSAESVDEPRPLDEATNQVLGLQGRLWAGGAFVGAHVGVYSTTLTNTLNSDEDSGSDIGYGAIVGGEMDNGLYVTGQADFFTIGFEDADLSQTGTRLSFGYRF